MLPPGRKCTAHHGPCKCATKNIFPIPTPVPPTPPPPTPRTHTLTHHTPTPRTPSLHAAPPIPLLTLPTTCSRPARTPPHPDPPTWVRLYSTTRVPAAMGPPGAGPLRRPGSRGPPPAAACPSTPAVSTSPPTRSRPTAPGAAFPGEL